MIAPVLASLLFLAGIALAQNENAVELTSEPHHHFTWENQFLRVYNVQVVPNDATLLHIHRHDYVFIMIGQSQIRNEVQAKSPATLDLQDGEVRMSKAGLVHLVKNTGQTPFKNVTVEFLQDKNIQAPKSQSEAAGTSKALKDGKQTILFMNDGISVSSVELQPNGQLPLNAEQRGQLLIAVSKLELHGNDNRTERMKPGESKWIEPTKGPLSNGDQPARFVVVEVK